MKNLIRSVSLALAVLFASTLFAGEVRTKDRPKKEGGYYGGSYHLKGKGDKESNVKKDQNWRNPFKGFGKSDGKPKKQGTMPHGGSSEE